MANGFRPFGDAPRILQGLAQQKLNPRNQLIEGRLREIQNEQLRSNILTDFLINADLSKFKPSEITATVGAIMADPNLAIKAADAQLKENIFEQRAQAFRRLAPQLEAAATGGLSPSERGGLAGQVLGETGRFEDVEPIFESIPGEGETRLTQARTATERERAESERALQEKRRAAARKIRKATRNIARTKDTTLKEAVDDTRQAVEDLRIEAAENQGQLTPQQQADLEFFENSLRELMGEQRKRLGLEGIPKNEKEAANRIQTLETLLNQDPPAISQEMFDRQIAEIFVNLGGDLNDLDSPASKKARRILERAAGTR